MTAQTSTLTTRIARCRIPVDRIKDAEAVFQFAGVSELSLALRGDHVEAEFVLPDDGLPAGVAIPHQVWAIA